MVGESGGVGAQIDIFRQKESRNGYQWPQLTTTDHRLEDD
ncbi:hypothetical protein TorRG33x02_119410 [Trema orientale]|uniref:Uncharacterized protein n=1 Tax=Trema orientale TaxID=63057 RepID=A0A2P5F3H2_TREOI|nr:hypothetical protein TorRG33x02_119410 [Trema orientale]